MSKIDDLLAAAKENRVPIIRESGLSFILDYIRRQGVKDILEVGTAIGYSSIMMALAGRDIRVDTIEADADRYEEAVANIASIGLDGRIRVFLLDAITYQADRTYDLIFIDGPKAQYLSHMKQMEPYLKKGGVFIFDNINFHGMVDDPSLTHNRRTRDLIRKLGLFRRRMLEDDRYHVHYYRELGDGLMLVRPLTEEEMMTSQHTPHINAERTDFAKTVLMPGDPLRSKWVAETFFTDARLVNNVRGVQGYTGLYKGEKVSVMASGMGMPSMGIYSWELFSYFGVENIIRIGSAGALQEKIRVRDLVLGQGACTESSWTDDYRLTGRYAPIASYELLEKAVAVAREKGLTYHVGNILSSDHFYHDNEGIPEALQSVFSWQKMGVLAVEMEAAALYSTAARLGKRALAICTISDHIVAKDRDLTAEERQTGLEEMIEVALDTAIAFH